MSQELNQEELLAFIKRGIQEDVGEGDHTSMACIPVNKTSTGEFLIKENGIVCGLEVAGEIFSYLDPEIEFTQLMRDGAQVLVGDIVATIQGNSRTILKGERLALNTMQHLSGICSLSRRFADEVSGLDVTILDTRKTTPGLRFLEKWAVRKGGCENYRNGLYDWIMLKDNHIQAAGSITDAVRKVNQYLDENKLDRDITVEIQNLKELDEVLQLSGVRRVMCDNFEIPLLEKAVKITGDKIETEASGGVTLNTVRDIAMTGVDFISVGALTHSAPNFDISLNFIDK